MSWNVAISLSNAFIEVAASKGADASSLCSTTWYRPGQSTSQQLKAFFEAHQVESIDRLFFATQFGRNVIEKRLGSSPTFICTFGFENWLEINLPIIQRDFLLNPTRPDFILDKNLIFSLSERTLANGEIEKPIDDEELEFLISKLKMNEIEKVALGFLHSDANPKNELSVKERLTKEGIQVFCSHEYQTQRGYETSRWWAGTLEAYMSSSMEEALDEFKSSMEKATDALPEIQLAHSKWMNESPKSWLPSLFSHIYSLDQISDNPTLYLGYEQFILLPKEKNEKSTQWSSPFGPVQIQFPQFLHLKTQPTLEIQNSFLQSPEIGRKLRGFEPGPMCLGKGLTPLLFDIFYLYEKGFESLPIFESRYSKKSANRIYESLMTLAPGMTKSEISSCIDKLFEEAMNSLLVDLIGHSQGKKITVTGPLATPLSSHLKRMPVEIEFKIDSDQMVTRTLLGEFEN